MKHLKENGKLLIGDISFKTRGNLETCRRDNIDVWDEDEIYFVSEEIAHKLQKTYKCKYTQVSHCGGLYIIQNVSDSYAS